MVFQYVQPRTALYGMKFISIATLLLPRAGTPALYRGTYRKTERPVPGADLQRKSIKLISYYLIDRLPFLHLVLFIPLFPSTISYFPKTLT